MTADVPSPLTKEAFASTVHPTFKKAFKATYKSLSPYFHWKEYSNWLAAKVASDSPEERKTYFLCAVQTDCFMLWQRHIEKQGGSIGEDSVRKARDKIEERGAKVLQELEHFDVVPKGTAEEFSLDSINVRSKLV